MSEYVGTEDDQRGFLVDEWLEKNVEGDPSYGEMADAEAYADEQMRQKAVTTIDGEVVVALADGNTLRSGCHSTDFTSGEWVRLCDADGEEILYWHQDEWATDPILVMGAIINAAAGLRKGGE